MRALCVYENLDFERGQDPKKSLGLGVAKILNPRNISTDAGEDMVNEIEKIIPPPTVESIEESVEEIPEPVQEEIVETVTPPDPSPVDNTQDVEEVQVKEDPKPTAEELERERIEKERIETEKQERIETEKQERIEREEREKQEQIEKERQEQADRLNNAGKSAFGNQGVGETEGSEGITEGDGNQGVPDGSPDADRYDTGGGLGDGISVGGLGSRGGSVPKPNLEGCEVTQKIEITVDIQVDRDGKVISAIVRSGTFQDKCIWDTVVAAAKLSRFSADQSANYQQTGWIKYIITP